MRPATHESATVACAACWAPVDIGDQDAERAWYCSRFCATVADRVREGTSQPRALVTDAPICSCMAIDSAGRARGWHTPACFVSARVSRAAYLMSGVRS